ncbi:MAG: aminotransferase class V-fold PLP-dependent enzyme [Treponema sp.]|nr:aminotransferase class V-fold PLP-dependent enzyme [Treponema sp.]
MKKSVFLSEMRHYFDWAATAPPDPLGVIENEKIPFGNPSSRHVEGRAAQRILEDARERCARVLGVSAEQLYWTSGGTEANALVLHSLLLRPQVNTVLFSAVEHPSVRENCFMLERLGKRIASIPVEPDGRVAAACLEKTLGKHPDAGFAAVMLVNNETGAVNNIEEISEYLQKRRIAGAKPVHLHCDMVQGLGKTSGKALPLSWVDSASMSGHKIGAPRGIGLLYLKKPLETIFKGGEQERGVRAGTENTGGAVALASCVERYAGEEAACSAYENARERFARLIGFLGENERYALIPEDRGVEDSRFSPYILQMRVKDLPGEVLVRALDNEGFAISTGSACSSATNDRPVLAAMGASKDARLEGVRISQGRSTAMDDIDALIETLKRVIRRY